MKLGEMVKQHLSNISGRRITDLEIIRALVSNVNRCRVVYDMSTYSFILELTMQDYELMDLFGFPLASSIDVPGNDALGTSLQKFGVKLSFVNAVNVSKDYHGLTKQSVFPENALKESITQKRIFETFGCIRTTAPFVPDVIAHHVLAKDKFNEIFARILSPGHAMDIPVAKSNAPGVVGNSEEIYDWINEWFDDDGIRIDVILMEMLDVERAGPGVPRVDRFQMVNSLRANQVEYGNAAIRMTAQIATLGGKKITLRDSHGGNGLATPNGLQVYLIDLGGIFDLNVDEDVEKVLRHFRTMCRNSILEAAEESMNAKRLVSAMDAKDKTTKSMLLKRHPSIEDLCGFFEIPFDATRRGDMEVRLNEKFQEELTAGFVDFMCVAPTPENVHRTLMLTALIDFVSNRMECNHPYCQCGDVLSVVYENRTGSYPSAIGINVHTFCDFRTFLKTFSLNSLPPGPGQTRLNEVVAAIQEIVAPCSSGCAAIQPQQLRPNWRQLQEAAAQETRRLAQEAEARRLAQEAETRRLAQEAEAQKPENKIKASRNRLQTLSAAMDNSRVAKSSRQSKQVQALNVVKVKSAFAKAQAAQAQAQAQAQAAQAPEQPPLQNQETQVMAFPFSWMNPRSWSMPSWLKRKKGGTRKHKNRNHQHNATKRKY
jgi:hypothetical protein